MADTQYDFKQTFAASEEDATMTWTCEMAEEQETDQQDTWQFEPAICG